MRKYKPSQASQRNRVVQPPAKAPLQPPQAAPTAPLQQPPQAAPTQEAEATAIQAAAEANTMPLLPQTTTTATAVSTEETTSPETTTAAAVSTAETTTPEGTTDNGDAPDGTEAEDFTPLPELDNEGLLFDPQTIANLAWLMAEE